MKHASYTCMAEWKSYHYVDMVVVAYWLSSMLRWEAKNSCLDETLVWWWLVLAMAKPMGDFPIKA